MDSLSLSRKTGFMNKKSAIGRGYRPRFFELDSISEYVTYYTDNPYTVGLEKAKYRGTIGLCDAKIDTNSSSNGGKPKITIRTRNGKKYEMTCSKEEDRNSWVEALQSARDSAVDPNKLLLEWKKSKDCEKCLHYTDADVINDGNTPDDMLDTESIDLFSLSIRDGNGVDAKLGDIVGSRVTVMVLLRHFGCPGCKRTVAQLKKKFDLFEALGLQLVAIGTGTSVQANIFKSETNFPGIVYSDPERKTYRYLGARRGFKYTFSLQSLAGVTAAISEGFAPGAVQGDSLQLGGTFVLSKEEGIVYSHIDRFVGHSANFDEVHSVLRDFLRIRPTVAWSNVSAMSWSDVAGTGAVKDKTPSAFAPQDKGFHVERGSSRVDLTVGKPYVIDNMLSYQKFFAPNEHQIWISHASAEGTPDEMQLAIVVGMVDGPRGDMKFLVFHTSGEIRRLVPHFRFSNDAEMLRYLCTQSIGCDLPLTPVHDSPTLRDELVRYESQGAFKQFKVGLMYAQEGQTEESQFYLNSADSVSPDYEEFLQFIGSKITLRGFPQFKGGLDSKKDTTGTHSVFANLEDIAIMFHVGTMIPLDKDHMALERKRHIGNDVVVILFKEGTQTIDPTAFRSQFNHVFIVVSKEKKSKTDGKTFYRVEVMTKPQVAPFLPVLPDPPVFEKSSEFRTWLLTKAINSEKETSKVVPIFKNKMDLVRADLIRQIIQKTGPAVAAPRSQPIESKRSKMKKAKSDIKSDKSSLIRSVTPQSGKLVNGMTPVARAAVVRNLSGENAKRQVPRTNSNDAKTASPTSSLSSSPNSSYGNLDIFSALEAEMQELTASTLSGSSGSLKGTGRRMQQRSVSSEARSSSKIPSRASSSGETPTSESASAEVTEAVEPSKPEPEESIRPPSPPKSEKKKERTKKRKVSAHDRRRNTIQLAAPPILEPLPPPLSLDDSAAPPPSKSTATEPEPEPEPVVALPAPLPAPLPSPPTPPPSEPSPEPKLVPPSPSRSHSPSRPRSPSRVGHSKSNSTGSNHQEIVSKADKSAEADSEAIAAMNSPRNRKSAPSLTSSIISSANAPIPRSTSGAAVATDSVVAAEPAKANPSTPTKLSSTNLFKTIAAFNQNKSQKFTALQNQWKSMADSAAASSSSTSFTTPKKSITTSNSHRWGTPVTTTLKKGSSTNSATTPPARARPGTSPPSTLQISAPSPSPEERRLLSPSNSTTELRKLSPVNSVAPLTNLSTESLLQTIRTGGEEQIIATIQHLADSQAHKRIVVVNEADSNDKELVVLKPDDTLQTFLEATQQEANKTVKALLFEGIALQEKHLRKLQDKDTITVRYA